MSRNYSIDIAKGLGILIVVFGHSPLVWQDSKELHQIIFSFHMPLFFFISGVFFKPEKPFTLTLKEKADGLLKPYGVILFTLGFFVVLAGRQDLKNYVTGVLLATGGTIWWMPLWFLPHLFLVVILSWLLVRAGLRRTVLGSFVSTLLLALLLFTGIYCVRDFWRTTFDFFGSVHVMNGLPWSVDILPITVFYFLLGFNFSKEARGFKPTWIAAWACMVIFGAVHMVSSQTIDLNNRQYDGFLFPVLASLTGIYLVFCFSYCIAYFASGVGGFFALCGRASLIVLIFHWPIQGAMSKIATILPSVFYVPAMLMAFFSACAVSLGIWKVAESNKYIARMLLPIKKEAGAAASEVRF